MVKKQQKWIALFVTLTFVWLLQVSTMPLAAAGTTETVSSASAEQGLDYVEAVGQKTAPTRKKSILPIILIGVGFAAVAAVLFLVVLKTKYNPGGTWSGPFSMSGQRKGWTGTVVFTGDEKTGTTLYSDSFSKNQAGMYKVDGNNITFTMTDNDVTFTGLFESKDIMSGKWLSGQNTGLWKLVRAGTSAQIQVPQDLAGANSRHFQ